MVSFCWGVRFQLTISKGPISQLPGWELSSIAFVNSELLSFADTNLGGIAFKTDGTVMYIGTQGGPGAGVLYEYALSEPWDINTASLTQSKDLTATIADIAEIRLKSDGSKIYFSDNDNSIFQFSLSPAWDISAISYDSKSHTDSIAVTGFEWNSDGSTVFIMLSDNVIYAHDCSVSWDISTTAVDSGNEFDTGTVLARGISINLAGTRILWNDLVSNVWKQIDLSTPGDLTTGLARSITVSNNTNPFGCFVSPDGRNAFSNAFGVNDRIYRWSVI